MIKIIPTRQDQLAMTVYPAVGYPTGSAWRVTFSGVAWRTPVVFNRRQRMLIRMLGNVMRASPEQLEGEPFSTRINPFMADAFHRLPVTIRVGHRQFPLRRKTKRNGRFEESILIPDSAIQAAQCGPDQSRFEVVSQRSQRTLAEGLIQRYDQTGVSIISDIDDTIKDSQVDDKRELLANTFLRQFRGVDGMAELYQHWHRTGAAFHYVSSSPWQLFDALQSINTELGFPHGTMHLRNFRLRDQLLKRLIIRRQGKGAAIRKLLQAMPERRFILIGDSGEKDPHIYRKACLQFPGRVIGVFIRDLPYRPFDGERYEKLVQSLPDGICSGFQSADELQRLTEPLFEPSFAS